MNVQPIVITNEHIKEAKKDFRKRQRSLYSRERYARDRAFREKIKQRAKESQLENRKWFSSVSRHYTCVCCFNSNRECIDFHHVNPREKEHGIARFLGHSGRQVPFRVKNELMKCVPVCRNCHAQIHSATLLLTDEQKKFAQLQHQHMLEEDGRYTGEWPSG